MAARPDRLAGRFGGLLGASMRAETNMSLRGLVAHARHGAQNMDLVKSYERMVRRHVVGPQGVRLQMDIQDPNGAKDTRANALIEKAWKKWAKRGNCTICGKLSWWNVENIAATMLAREGNFLLRTYTGRRFGSFGFQVQVLSIDLLDIDYRASLGADRFVDAGIEYDHNGKVLAYHMWSQHPTEWRYAADTRRIRIPADQIIHVQRFSEAMQDLGVPESHTALRRFNMLNQYEEAALTAAHFGAAAMVFFENEDGDAPGAKDQVPQDIEAGTTATLPAGYKVSPWAPNYPDGDMPDFTAAMQMGGSAGLGVSYAGLTGDTTKTNFASFKAGKDEERDEWRMFQRDLYEGLHDQVFMRWLPAGMITTQVPLPMAKIEKFDAASWRPRGWTSVNPKDDAVKDAADINNGLRAPSDIVAERGDDYERVTKQTAADLKLREQEGLPPPGAVVAQSTAASPASVLAEEAAAEAVAEAKDEKP